MPDRPPHRRRGGGRAQPAPGSRPPDPRGPRGGGGGRGAPRGGAAGGQRFALDVGATWAGDTEGGSEVCEPGDGGPPKPLDAAIIFAPVGELVAAALRAVAPGGSVVSAGIHMSDIPSFPYEILWGERVVRSVANLTRRDGEEFLQLAPQVPVRTRIEEHALDQANEALERLRSGKVTGAAVLRV